jgi:cob(I)alamin adenosyltransferase
MVVLNRIYTRTGDDGTTSLGSGDRRKKYDLRVAAYGTLDEVNATIGLVRLHTAGNAALDPALGRIQNDLFDVEADLCMPSEKGKGPAGARLSVTVSKPASERTTTREVPPDSSVALIESTAGTRPITERRTSEISRR